MRRLAGFILLLPLIIAISGCAPLIIGGAAGVLGAYAVSKDTIQGETDKPYDSLWDSALTISKIKGAIKQADVARGYIELETESSRVWIRLVRLTHSTTRLKVAARKLHLPNLVLAQDMFIKIIEGIK